MQLSFRQANEKDLPILVKMLADDQLGATREDTSLPLNSAYLDAFKAIDKGSNNELIIVEDHQQVIGMLQLTYIPYLSHKGAWRCLIEAVRVHQDYRGQGVGSLIFEWAIQQAKKRHCFMVQLTSNKERDNAIRFYKKLGFVASPSHEGFKLTL